MHELGITQAIVEACAERSGAARVVRVTVQIGRLSAVMPDAVRFCFDICAQGTAVEGAELAIEEPPGRGCCRRCGAESVVEGIPAACPICGATDLEIVGGRELLVRSMEIAAPEGA